MKKSNFFYGLAIIRITERTPIFLEKIDKSIYCINNKIYLYIKYSTKRLSPWQFTFEKQHSEKIASIHNSDNKKIYVILVCNDDGICCLDFDEFKTIVSPKSNLYPKWIKVYRKKGEKYSVAGSDGILPHKIGDSDYPKRLLSNEE